MCHNSNSKSQRFTIAPLQQSSVQPADCLDWALAMQVYAVENVINSQVGKCAAYLPAAVTTDTGACWKTPGCGK